MKNKPCTFCGKDGHTSLTCFAKPKKQPKKRGKIAEAYTNQRKIWIRKNGGETAYWFCYLQTTPLCPRKLDIQTMVLEHPDPKGRDPTKRFDYKKLKPSCTFCNSDKGSLSYDQYMKKLAKSKKHS